MVAIVLQPPRPFIGQETPRRITWATVITAVAALHLCAALWVTRGEVLTAPTPLPSGQPMSVSWVPLSAPSPQATSLPSARPQGRANTPSTPAAPAPRQPQPAAATHTATPAQAAAIPLPVTVPSTSSPSAATTDGRRSEPAAPAHTQAALATGPTPNAPATPPAPKTQPTASAATPPSFDAAYLNNPQPSYPAVSRREGEQGRVLLRVHVLPSGQPDQVDVHTSSGFDRLDKAARTAVARWTFSPARSGDRAVAEWVTVPIQFSLQ
jgi:protein TonB